MVGAADQAVSIKPHEPPLQIISVVVQVRGRDRELSASRGSVRRHGRASPRLGARA